MKNKILFIIIPICALCYYLIFTPCGSYLFDKRFYKKEFSGVIVKTYVDVKNHNDRIIIIDELNETHKKKKIFTPDCNDDIYCFVNLGDTIIKEKDCNLLRIKNYNLDTLLTYDLKYPRVE